MSQPETFFTIEPPYPTTKKDFTKGLEKEIGQYITNQNPLLAEMTARAEFVRNNNARAMTEAIQDLRLNASLYEQMLLAIILTEGISSWSVQEIIGQINAKSQQIVFNSPEIHDTYILNQIKRFSIFQEDKASLQQIPLNALRHFPSKNTNIFEFFGEHAVFCVIKPFLGHTTVNDIMQPLLETHSVDQSLQLLIKNPPERLEELFDPVAQVERLSKI